MEIRKIICPFCGCDITNNINPQNIINCKQTVKRDYNIGQTWAGGYLQETKYIKHFRVRCCENCYKEHQNWDHWSNRYILFAAPLGIIAGIAWHLYCVLDRGMSFSIISLFFCSVLGVFIFAFPNIILYALYHKSTNIRHAKQCNALI